MATPEASIYTAIETALNGMASPDLDAVYPLDIAVGSGHTTPCAMVFLKTGNTSGRADNIIRNTFLFGVRVVDVASGNTSLAATQSNLRQAVQAALHGATVQGASDFGVTGSFEYGATGITAADLVWVEFEYQAKYLG